MMLFGMFVGFVAGVFVSQTWRDYIKRFVMLWLDKLEKKLKV